MIIRVARAVARCAALLAASGVAPAFAAQGTSTATLSPVVVTATPLSSNADDLATIVSNIDRQQILQQGGATLGDALADTPGVTATSFAAGASRPVIRGFDANRVRVLEDGIGSFDVSDVGPDHGVPIDPLSAQRIEVVRGAATLRYGSQAIGGVVNAINNRVPTALPNQVLSGQITGTYGSGADSGEGSALFDGKVGPLAWHADGFVRHAGDYAIPDGTQSNSYSRGDGYSGGASYFFGGSHIGLGAVQYGAIYGIPSDTTFINMKQTKYLTKSSLAIDLGPLKTVNIDGGYGDYQHQEIDPQGHLTLSTFRDRGWDSRAEALFDDMGPFDATALGVQLEHKNFSALGEGGDYLLPTTTRSAAAFLFTELRASTATRVQIGARMEQVKADGTPISGDAVSRQFDLLSGSVGLLYRASQAVHLGLTATSAARAPGQSELFARGPHDGPGTFEVGDPSLSLERSNSLEGTLRVTGNRMHFQGSLWSAWFDGYIYGDLTGRTCDATGTCVAGGPGDLRELLYRQGGSWFRGAEGKLSDRLWHANAGDLQADLQFDYVRATLSSGGNVPRIPPYHVGLGLQWLGATVDAGLRVRYSGRQDRIASGETPTAGFTSVDMHVGWQPHSANSALHIELVGHNLTNTVQRNAIAFNKDLVELPGRDIRLVAEISF